MVCGNLGDKPFVRLALLGVEELKIKQRQTMRINYGEKKALEVGRCKIDEGDIE